MVVVLTGTRGFVVAGEVMANPNHVQIQADGDLMRSDNNNDNISFRGSKTSLSSRHRSVHDA